MACRPLVKIEVLVIEPAFFRLFNRQSSDESFIIYVFNLPRILLRE